MNMVDFDVNVKLDLRQGSTNIDIRSNKKRSVDSVKGKF